MNNLIFRASSIHRLMGTPKSIDESLVTPEVAAIQKKVASKRTDEEKLILAKLLEKSLSAGAKTLVKEMVRKKHHKAPSNFSGSKQTDKGHLVEESAILFLMQQEFISAKKNEIRFNNDWVTGEPDIITNDCVYDTKCPYTYWNMPYFEDDIQDKSIEAGYDWQQLVYLWLLRENDSFEPKIIDKAKLKYILMPTPKESIGRYNDEYLHYDFVLEMNPKDRISTYQINWDQSKIDLIKIKIEAARKYAETLIF